MLTFMGILKCNILQNDKLIGQAIPGRIVPTESMKVGYSVECGDF